MDHGLALHPLEPTHSNPRESKARAPFQRSFAPGPLLLVVLCVLEAASCTRGAAIDPGSLARKHALDWKASAGEPRPPAWPPVQAGSPPTVTTQIAVASLAPSSGFVMEDCWLAATDGSFEAPLTLRGGGVTFRLRLKAIKEVGEWPELRFVLDGKEIGGGRLDANAPDRDAAESFMSPRYRWVEATASTKAPGGPSRLRVDYKCSHFDPIERIGIRGILFDRLLVVESPGAADSCSGAAAGGPIPSGSSRHVLLIGLDGASWSVLLPLINRGLLPNLADLIEHGAYGPLNSEPRTYSPAIWNTIYTGLSRSVHGIDQMTSKGPDSYTSASHSSSLLRAPTIWQMASSAGMRCAIVGMNTTWPAQPVAGVLVSDRLLEANSEAGVWPPEQEAGVRAALADLASDGSLVPADIPPGLRPSATRDARAVALTRAYLAAGQPDLAAVYVTLPDHAGHLLWREHAPVGLEHRFPSAAPRRDPGPDGLERACMFVDGLVGSLLSSVQREKTAVVIVSDHSTDVADPVTAKRFRLGSLIRALAGESAYVPFEESWIVSQIYLNVRGREPKGVIDPAAKEQAARQLRDTLLSLRTVSGKRVFEAVEVGETSGAGAASNQPSDLVGILNGGLEANDSVSLPSGGSLPLLDVVHVLDNRTGTHDRFGIIVMAGAGIRSGVLVHSATILDIAPTVLALLGLPRPADLPGRPLQETLQDGVVSPCIISSYAPLVPPPSRMPPPGSDQIMGLSEEETRRLKSLGYVQ